MKFAQVRKKVSQLQSPIHFQKYEFMSNNIIFKHHRHICKVYDVYPEWNLYEY